MSSPPSFAPPKLGFVARWVMRFSWLNLFALLVVSLLLFVVSENWWFSSALTYVPRYPYLLPAVLLLLASVFWHRASITVNLISTAMVAVPIMGLTLPLSQWVNPPTADDGTTLKIVSCNVQDFEPDFASVLAEIGRLNPDIIAFQDATREPPLLRKFLDSWHSIHEGEFYVASRFPVKLLAVGHCEAFDRRPIIKCEIELPTTKMMLFNLHHMTPRHGLRELDISSPITQHGSHRLSRFLALRAEETAEVRSFINESTDENIPAIIVGDFNMPFESNLYQENWLGYQNAFNTAGIGYGYTFPCVRQYRWPAGIPYIRLDHILTDSSWTIHYCAVGTVNGSDHRLITATISLP